MLVPIVFQFLCLVTLITSVPLEPRTGPGRGKVVIGYKNVLEGRAKAYNDAKTMVWYPPSGQQIGSGVYLTPGVGQWQGTDWNCAVWADADKWNAVPKVWIPAEDECGNPLYQEKAEFARNKYVKDLGIQDPDSAVFLSEILGTPTTTYQILVRENMLKGRSNDMGLGATCGQKKDGKWNLDVTVYADWRSWDILGLPEDLPPDPESKP